VAFACNLSYSGGRDQEDHGLKSVEANSPQDPTSKKFLHKNGLVEWLKVQALSSSPSTEKSKKSLLLFLTVHISLEQELANCSLYQAQCLICK
jgi:hypothetical protein